MRICQSCNAEQPLEHMGTTCKSCRAILDVQYCKACEQWKPLSDFHVTHNQVKPYPRKPCKVCGREVKKKWDKEHRDQRYARDRRFWDKRKDNADTMYEEWKQTISKLPTKLLDEWQWKETCRYFNGCALCGSTVIETRQYFIPFNEGGTYSAWNIYPACGKCSTDIKLIANPFQWMDRYWGRRNNVPRIDSKYADNIVEFFKKQIKKVEQGEQ